MTVKRRVIWVSVAVLTAVWIACLIRVNIENPPIPIEQHSIGEAFTMFSGTAEVVLNRVETCDGNRTKDILLETNEELYTNYTPEDMSMLLFTYTIKNCGEKLIETPFGAVANGKLLSPTDDMALPWPDVSEAMSRKASEKSWDALAPGESTELIVAYYLDRSWMSDKRWQQRFDTTYEICLDDYPIDLRVYFEVTSAEQ